MTIYLDAVWLLNFLLDFMILMLTQYITKANTSRLKLLFGAFIASVIVPITLFFPNSLLTAPMGKIIYSLFIILCTFGYENTRQFLKKLLFFYFISFVLGGGLIALHFLLNKQMYTNGSGVLTYQTGYGDQISWLFIGFGFPLIWYFTKERLDKHAYEKFRHDQLYEVDIQILGKTFSTIAYVDSGNQLVDPFSRKPVVICDQAFMENWFSKEEIRILEQAQDKLVFEGFPDKLESLMNIVPYQGVNGNRTFMIVLKPENMLVKYENKQISTNKLLIGIQFGELAADGSYHCLLHPELFKHSVATSA
ncbi:sigma-E processing peptidase SpoIIGA [Aquibacillus salsiterrae]|uniref:Sporulation sigma-E factor-processing peptidase n=1 Tax=Aquibacillus salsiterrae TaxID=2950439 RepID=A0A9X3WBV1_9BACI|nr:sigma-E processing peptidase SpoIIGA [Aquibacillus salsiterrae]MDC3416472.1 sigma-E processing peptidase SpoIIGA [Aquibacillus salsiterrae]